MSGTAVRNQLDTDAGTDSRTDNDSAGHTAVWHDSDDDRVAVSLASNPRLRKLRDTPDDDIISGREYVTRLRRQYERLHPRPEWAMTQAARKRKRQSDIGNGAAADLQDDSDVSMSDGDNDSDDDNASAARSVQPLADLLRSAGALTRQPGSAGAGATNSLKRRKLQPEVIDIARLPPVTSSGPSSVESLQFHPYYPILLASGPSATASLYHVSPQPPNPNPLLTSLHVKKTALRHSEFCRFKTSPSGKFIALVSSARAGGGGSINVLDATTLSWICSCRIDSQGGVADFDWWATSFTVIGKSGQVSEYSIADRRVVARWYDDGAVGSTVLATSRDGRWTAIGSSAGIVNIYDRYNADFKHTVLAQAPTGSSNDASAAAATCRPHPARTLDQLTTPISHLVFSPDSQLLVVASRWKKNALRLVHLPSCTVFRNWPTDSTNLGRISSVAVGGQGDGSASMLLAVGNERGAVRLWEIRP
ncbi:hypothetical protein DV738_g5288, partial [Chaetothyriales sp. CBS 135597]